MQKVENIRTVSIPATKELVGVTLSIRIGSPIYHPERHPSFSCSIRSDGYSWHHFWADPADKPCSFLASPDNAYFAKKFIDFSRRNEHDPQGSVASLKDALEEEFQLGEHFDLHTALKSVDDWYGEGGSEFNTDKYAFHEILGGYAHEHFATKPSEECEYLYKVLDAIRAALKNPKNGDIVAWLNGEDK